MKKLLFIFTLMLFPMLASAQTVSDVQNSGCTARARGAAGEGPVPTIMLTKEGNILSVEVLNYEANCCTDNFHVTSNINGGSDGSPSSLSISVVPVGALDCDCECPFNVSFTIRDLEPNSFYLKCWWYEGLVELTNGVPLVLEYKVEDVVIGEMSFRLLKVMHKAKLTKWSTEEKEIRIPSEVTYEGENYTVTSIDHDAFVDLDHLAKIAIPKSIRSTDLDVDGIIWANPFRECKSLEWIEVEEGCPLFSSVDGVLFAKNKTMLLGYPIASPRETYTVPEGVTNIRSGSFYHNKYLRKLIIPEGVTYLGWHLFSDTKSLEALYIKGVLDPECIVDGLFGDMSTNVNIYVLPSEVDKFKAIYKGPVYPISEESQEYFPEGTKWTEIRLDTLKYDSWYSKVGNEWVPNFETIEYYVKGEYPDMDWVYKKVYTNGPEWTDSLTLLIRETEYNGHNSILASVLLHEYDGDNVLWPGEAYQFDWSIGKGLYYQDILMSNTTSMKQPYFYYGIIDEIKEGYFGGARPLKYVDLDGKAPEDETGLNRYVSTNGGRIIQGIGITEWNDGECLFGPPNPYYASTWEHDKRHYRSMLVHFERNGEVLYNVWPEASLQEDYIPFVEIGKRWNVIRSDFDEGSHFEQYTLRNEEVVKDGKTYLKMYRTEDGLNTLYDAGLLREEDRKVYFFDNDTQKEYLMFDYSLKAGDTYETYSYDEQKMVSYKVMSVGDYREGPDVVRYDYNQAADSMDTYHRYLQKWIVARTDNGIEKTWIEGVGSLEGPLANLRDVVLPDLSKDYLTYVEDYSTDLYLPFSFYDTMNKQIHGCNLPTGAEDYSYDRHHHLTYELEGNRLHVYGDVYTQCGPNNYAYFIEKLTDDPLVRKIHFKIQEVEPLADCMALHSTNFYVPGFDTNMNYIVIDNNGEEHPVINKTPQMAYRPFVEDGKVWKVGDVSDNPVQRVEYYYFDGDTIISGRACKQMIRERFVSPNHPDYDIYSQSPSKSYVGAWYEEEQKVYEYDTTDKQFKLMYDFSANAYDTLQINDQFYIIGARQTGGLKGFKGVYRDVTNHMAWKTTWLEGVGGLYSPIINIYPGKVYPAVFLMACTVGDEVIYLNDEYQDGATPEKSNAPKQRLDFTHIIKTKPRAPMMRTAEQPLYGEYNDQQLGINLDPLAEAYLVRITDESGKTVYEKAVNAGNIVGLNIDISAYPKGRYTVTVENSREAFTGEFETDATGIVENVKIEKSKNVSIYNLQGQRISTLQKGLNIVNGRKVLVK